MMFSLSHSVRVKRSRGDRVQKIVKQVTRLVTRTVCIYVTALALKSSSSVIQYDLPT